MALKHLVHLRAIVYWQIRPQRRHMGKEFESNAGIGFECITLASLITVMTAGVFRQKIGGSYRRVIMKTILASIFFP